MIKLEKDEGFVEIEVDGNPAPVKLDLFEASNNYGRLCDRHEDPVERGDAWCAWLAERGVPGLSHGAAYRLAGEIANEVEAFKKKHVSIWESSASPDSSDSGPPD